MILTPLQKLPKIGAIQLLPKALKSCPKSNKSGHTADDVKLHFTTSFTLKTSCA